MRKKIIMLIVALLSGMQMVVAQNSLNNNGDNIIGVYAGKQGEESFKVRISKQNDGKYKAQIIWMEHDKDANGKKLLDSKNPNKSLRSTPCDRIVLFSDLEYNAKEKRWDGTKIYDPQRGIKAKLVADFDNKGRLRLKGSLMGISESVYWEKQK